jgi:GTP-binding protein Era
MKKFATIALIGAPNAGKSTLTNQLVDQKISIVSPKVQTTRSSIKAILTQDQTQLVFVDTPGIFIPKKERALERVIVRNAWQSIKECDFVCLVIDSTKGFSANIIGILADLEKHEIKPVIVLNKIDLLSKSKLLVIISEFNNRNLTDIFFTSASMGEGIEKLREFLFSLALNAPWQFDENDISDAPMKYLATEITREKVFLNLQQDLPYSIKVETEQWQNFDNGDIKIKQKIIVLKESQKMIVLGKKGSMIKKIGQDAREDIEKLIGSKIHLFIFVKVDEKWLSDIGDLGVETN